MSKDVKYLDHKLFLENKKIEKLKQKLTIQEKPSRLIKYVDDKNADLSFMNENIYHNENYSQEQMEFYKELSERLDRSKALTVQLETLRCKLNILVRIFTFF